MKVSIDEFGSCIVEGVVIGICLIAWAFISGSTFGQRCTVEYVKDSQDWRQCVKRLAEGGEV